MKIKKAFLAGIALAMMFIAAPLSASAAGGIAGTWSIVDRGPGGWAGGTLNADWTANGGGELAYKADDGSQEVAHIKAVSWSLLSPTFISLCATITGMQGPDWPIGVPVFGCLPLEVSGAGAPVQSLFDEDTYTKVMLK